MIDPPPPTSLTHGPLDPEGVPPSAAVISAVRALAPATTTSDALKCSVLPDSEIVDACQALPPQVVAWAIEESARTVEMIEAFYPGVPDLPVDSIARAIESTLLQICRLLVGGTELTRFTDEYRGFSRDAARRGVHVRLIVDAMRIVQQHWVSVFLDVIGGVPASPDLQQILTITSRVFDAVVDTFITEYLAEREQLLAGQLAWRRATVQGLCEGSSSVDTGLVQSQLGIDITRYHLALVLWFPGIAAGYELERVARQITSIFPENTLLTVPVDDGQMWAWLSFPCVPTPDTVTNLDGLRPSVPGVRVAYGPVCAGAEGFRQSHWQARDSAAAARISHTSDTVTSWDTTGLVTLLGSDLERARWFVSARLGPLARSDAAAAEQRSTLRSYIESNQSLVHTATAQHVHRNTVVYRIRRIEDTLGHPISQRRTELYCALLLADYFGTHVLLP
ncbi:CdaR family transcriptional regulator [Rhodococcus sp. NCIMB 12038]|uniref:PucR family transcriptional regulator n=1 Tax=Rhodococcus sp. NCIMB 12038 TaxID=933800 RepID=UPI000B3C6093|nr:PucR family transcriptional regulator [Rhodococcus sp. NCIMB 12038]OUS94384.1 hypothetical protein CA951_18470 [Rhodococcus sp. NCIMB 12038]